MLEAERKLIGFLAAAYTFYVFAVFTTLLRTYSRAWVLRYFRSDDYFIVVGVVVLGVVMAMVHCMIREFILFFRGNEGLLVISPNNRNASRLSLGIKYQYIGGIHYLVSIGFVKLSWLAFYFRILPAKPYHRILYALTFIIIGFTTGLTLATIFACNPIAGSWDPTIPGLNCRVGVFESHMAANIFNTITDFVILVLPIPMVVQLRADWRKKCALLVLFSIGVIGTAVTVVRTVKTVEIRRIRPDWPGKWLVEMMMGIMWAIIEAALFIACANLPAIYALSQPQRGSQVTPGGGKSKKAGYHRYADEGGTSHPTVGDHGGSRNQKSGPAGFDFDLQTMEQDKETATTAATTTTTTGTGTSTVAYGHTSFLHTDQADSQEHIIEPPEGIHLSTRVVVNVEDKGAP